MKILGTGWYMTYYFFNKKGAKLQSMKSFINPDLEITKLIWSLMDAKGIDNIIKLTIPSIKYSENIYLLKTVKAINFKFLDKMIEKSENPDFKFNKECSLLEESYLKELDKDKDDKDDKNSNSKMNIKDELIRLSVDSNNAQSK